MSKCQVHFAFRGLTHQTSNGVLPLYPTGDLTRLQTTCLWGTWGPQHQLLSKHLHLLQILLTTLFIFDGCPILRQIYAGHNTIEDESKPHNKMQYNSMHISFGILGNIVISALILAFNVYYSWHKKKHPKSLYNNCDWLNWSCFLVSHM